MGISSRLTTTASVRRVSRTADSQGGFTHGETTVGNISCRISMKNADERLRANKEEGLGSYKVFTLTTADLQVGDDLVVGSLRYEVIALIRPSRGNHYEWEADLIESRA